ncbi:hypothetical protein NXS19_012473 [Fusarium pseudograminearum]|nr:hypothetical protein NXS19_012473 [Fusarium pseudograminearum]
MCISSSHHLRTKTAVQDMNNTYLAQRSAREPTSPHRRKAKPSNSVHNRKGAGISKSNLQMLRILGPVTSFQFPSSTP